MAENLGAEMEIIHVVESLNPYWRLSVPTDIPFDKLSDDLVSYSNKKMAHFLEENLHTTATHSAKIISGNDAAAEIIRHAKESGSELIIIATQGFKGLPKMIFGSVAERVLKQAPCPVMTVK